MHARLILVGLLVSSLATSLAAGCIHPRVVEDGDLQLDGLEHVAEETSRLRRLPYQRPVPSRAVNAEEQREFFAAYIAHRDAQLTTDTRLYQRLGLLPLDTTMQQMMKRQFGSAIAGFYTWDQGGQLYVSRDYNIVARAQFEALGWITGIDWAYEMVLSHELVHALQDQNFDLDGLAGDGLVATNEDLALARIDIVESDAGLYGFAYFHGLVLDSWLQRRLNTALAYVNYAPFALVPLIPLGKVPPFFTKLSLGHYTRGIGFVNSKLDEGGAEALNAAYRGGLLESTEQLLWPDKRSGGATYDPPVALVALAEEPSWLPGFVRARSNVFGELQWRLWLEETLWFPGAAFNAAAGWGGDRYELYVRGDDEVLVWRSTWDSEPDAEEAERALLAFVARMKARAEDAAEDVATTRVERRGHRVLFVDGTVAVDAALVERAFASFDEEAGVIPRPVLATEPSPATEPDAVLRMSNRPLPHPLPSGPTLEDRFMLSRRKFGIGFGGGVRLRGPELRHLAETVQPSVGVEMRWGFRRDLEWSDPFTLSLRARTPLGNSIITAGLDGFALPLRGRGAFASGHFRFTQAMHVSRELAFAGQLDSRARLDTDDATASFGLLTLALGIFAQPTPDVTLGFGVGQAVVIDIAGPLGLTRPFAPVPQALQLGSVLQRGAAFRQPLIEVRLFDVLHGFGTSRIAVDGAGQVVAADASLGLMLFF